MSTVLPIRREVLVNAGPATAFEVFTDDIGRWWPIGDFSVYGAGGTVTLANQEIVERSADGHSALWGTITRWEPPAAVAFTWHPGQTADRASHIEVTFTADTWVALMRRPGPAAPAGGRIIDDPRFGEHLAFLTRMQQVGYLVAAGPLADEEGAGMTVLRLPGAGRLEEASRLATEDDASVASGFFTVAVRPWPVVLTRDTAQG